MRPCKVSILFGLALCQSERNEQRETFAAKMFERLFAMESQESHLPPSLLDLKLHSGSFRQCDSNSDKFISPAEADKCSDNYFNNIGRDPIPIYRDPRTGKITGDIDPVDGKLNRREWELIHHKLCFGISAAMISLIKDKTLDQMRPEDYLLSGEDKQFLQDQLQYYFMFTDNRIKLNMQESQIQGKANWSVTEIAVFIGRLYNDALRKRGVRS